MNNNKIKKILIVGDGGVGKTAFIHRLNTGDFIKTYTMSKSLERTNVEYNEKQYVFDEVSGSMKFDLPLLTEHYDIAIVMYDVQNKISHRNAIVFWIPFVSQLCDKIIIAGNKCDIVPVNKTLRHDFLISVKSCYNIEKVLE